MTCLYIILILQHYLLRRFNSEYSKIWEESREIFQIKFIPIVITEYTLLTLALTAVHSFRGNPFNFIANLLFILCLLGTFLFFVAMQCLAFYLIELQKRIDD